MQLYGLAALFIVIIGISIFFLRRGKEDPDRTTSSDSAHSATASSEQSAATIPFQTDSIVEKQNALYRLAFGATRVDYRILGDHQRVLSTTQASVAGVTKEPRYFPRKPALLPKLLRAINSLESGRGEIVRLILQDTVLAGNVLKRANSVYYKSGHDVVESIDRAVTILGNEGLRAPVASAVMQPVFQLPVGFFEQFAPITWEQARRTAIAAEEFARINAGSDPFVAHLAGMLGSLARIVLFRLVNDKYRQKGNIMPRAEVFIQVMSEYGPRVAHDIAAAWEMSPAFLEALDAQARATPPEQMTTLGRTVYFANLCGSLATLHCHGECANEAAEEIMKAQGLAAETFARVWPAATQSEIS